jgi:ABC-type amino acid transport substrate-binding protein
VARWEDVRDDFDTRMRLTERGCATDFWTRYPEDVKLAQDLGCKAFRFSLSWARVEPTEGVFDDAVLDHYSELVDCVRNAGMQPVVTLHHYTWPLHVDMLSDAFPSRFEAYAGKVAARFGARVKYWITFNEPSELVYGYFKLWWQGEYRMPPGLPPAATAEQQVGCIRAVMRNVFLANKAARMAIKAVDDTAMVSANAFILGLPRWLQKFLDWRTKRLKDPKAWRSVERRCRRSLPTPGGAVDLVVAAMTVTKDRGEHVDFSTVYEVGSLALAVGASSTLTMPKQVQSVAVVKGSSADLAAAAVVPNATAQRVAGWQDAVAATTEGSVEAVLGDFIILEPLVKDSAGKLRFLADDLMPQRYAVAVPKGAPDLLMTVNEVIGHLPLTKLPGASPTLSRIRSRGYLRVGVRGGLPGTSFKDPGSGQWSGSEIDLAREIAAAVLGDGDSVRFQELDVRRRVSALSPFAQLVNPLLRWIDFLLAANNGNWWHLGMKGDLPSSLCPADCTGQQDFVALDYYWGVSALGWHRLGQLSDATQGKFDNAPVWVGGLGSVLDYLSDLFPKQPILIIENGCVEAADGLKRPDYISEHVLEVQRAVAKGRSIAGYICWSITSNREWGLHFAPGNDFGLYHVELDDDPELKRVSTDAADRYEQIIRARGVPG